MAEFQRYRVEADPGALAVEAAPEHHSRLAAFLARTDRVAVRLAASPYRTTSVVLALNASLAASLALASAWLLGDAAEPFRELAPLTWLSFAELGAIAAVAWAIHVRVGKPDLVRWADFWSLSAAAFVIFAIDEITQATIFLSHLMERTGFVTPAGFHDIDAFLLTVLFIAAAAVLLRYARALFAHPKAVALLAIGVALGAASQVFDATQAVTTSSFVIEESFKLAAEPFLLGGFLVVLSRVLSPQGGARQQGA